MTQEDYTNSVPGGVLVPAVRIGPKHQVTIPKDIFGRLRLEIGDYLDVAVTEHTIVMIPKKLIPKQHEWFYTKEWQKKEWEADEAIARGEVSGPFRSTDELMTHLKRASMTDTRIAKYRHANTDDHTI